MDEEPLQPIASASSENRVKSTEPHAGLGLEEIVWRVVDRGLGLDKGSSELGIVHIRV